MMKRFLSEIVQASSEHRKTFIIIIGLGSFCARGDIKKKKKKVRSRSRGCSVSRRRAMIDPINKLRSFRRRRRNDRGRRKNTLFLSSGLSVFSARDIKKEASALAVLRFLCE